MPSASLGALWADRLKVPGPNVPTGAGSNVGTAGGPGSDAYYKWPTGNLSTLKPPGFTGPAQPMASFLGGIGGQQSQSIPGVPNLPYYPESDVNPSTAANASVPTQMADFTQWLNGIMGQQFPYGGGGGGGLGLIPSPTS